MKPATQLPIQPQQPTFPAMLVITTATAGQRIDNYLTARFKNVPKGHLYRILRKGEVRVNKKRIKADYRLQPGDQVRIPPALRFEPVSQTVPSAPPPGLMAKLNKRILYEDEKLLIIAKPAGIAVHGGSGVSQGMIEMLRAMRPQEKNLALAHRLDKETSGCLIFTKKNSALREIHALLREGQVVKRYLALVRGHWPTRVKSVAVALQKNHLASGERIVRVDVEGKASLTEFRIVQRFAAATLLEARPRTGRTHQIRVHAAYQGHPLAGDGKYGDKTFTQTIQALGCKRLFLHAAALEFTLPSSGKRIIAEAPLDEDLRVCLDNLAQDSG